MMSQFDAKTGSYDGHDPKIKRDLFLTNAIRDCEQAAYALGIPEEELLERAGEACFKAVRNFFSQAERLLVLCGHGNNAGDGYVLARLAQVSGLDVTVIHFKPLECLPDTARHAALCALDAGVVCQLWDEDALEFEGDLVIDALLGIGLQGAVREPFFSVINQINQSELPVMSLDIPSGLNADTGCVMGVCVRADVTVTFIGRKLGMYTCDGPDYCGNIVIDALKLADSLARSPVAARIIPSSIISASLSPRRHNTHKGENGHVLVIGGGPGMPGAVWLVAEAALRVGAGVVTIATHPLYASFFSANLPEVMLAGIETPQDLIPLLQKTSVCVMGPGFGVDAWARALFDEMMRHPLPIIIDAQALSFLSEKPQQDDNWILTPHPGEAATLLGCSVSEVQNNRLWALTQLRALYGGAVVLKGVGTLVAGDDEDVFLCAQGNPGMATAGMGDVLSGIIGGLAAQGLSLSLAARLGVYLHAQAADCRAQKMGERGMLARDILPYVQQLVNPG